MQTPRSMTRGPPLLSYRNTPSRVPVVPQHSTIQHDWSNRMEEELLTVREVARALRVDDTTVRRWIKLGALEAVILPHSGNRQAYRVKKSTLATLLASPSLSTT